MVAGYLGWSRERLVSVDRMHGSTHRILLGAKRFQLKPDRADLLSHSGRQLRRKRVRPHAHESKLQRFQVLRHLGQRDYLLHTERCYPWELYLEHSPPTSACASATVDPGSGVGSLNVRGSRQER